MAGGMIPGRGESLAQRIANTQAAEAARLEQHGTAGFHGKRPAPWADVLRDAPPEAASTTPTPPEMKHCWYDGPYGRQAALLLEWSQGVAGHRRGRIAVATFEPDGWAIIEMWVEQDVLHPA